MHPIVEVTLASTSPQDTMPPGSLPGAVRVSTSHVTGLDYRPDPKLIEDNGKTPIESSPNSSGYLGAERGMYWAPEPGHSISRLRPYICQAMVTPAF